MSERECRIFVEWYDPERPNWGGWVSSGCSSFQADLVDFVARCGPPTKVEFRAHDEGWAEPTPCEDCGLSFARCRCDGFDPQSRPTPSPLAELRDYYLKTYGHLLGDKPPKDEKPMGLIHQRINPRKQGRT